MKIELKGLPTFSVNIGLYDEEKLKRVSKLVLEINDFNRDSVGDKFVSIMEGHRNLEQSLESYHRKSIRNQAIKKLEQSDITTKDEDGEIFGELDVEEDFSIEDVVIKNLEDEGLVKAFLDYRENTWLSEGSDVWRLMQLVEMGDKLAGYKLRNLLEETDGAELIRDVIENKAVYKRLKEIFMNDKE